MFIGRKTELKQLNEQYNSNKFEFAVIYGRRRIGKIKKPYFLLALKQHKNKILSI